jgi:hypothetical protein
VREAGLDVELEIQGDERELPPGVDLSAYRLVQEALTNTLKYAGPAQAWVTLRWREKELELEVANNGRTEFRRTAPATASRAARARRACGGTLEAGRGTAAVSLFAVIYHWSPPHDRESADRRRPVARPSRVPMILDAESEIEVVGRGVRRARGRPCRAPDGAGRDPDGCPMPNVDGLERLAASSTAATRGRAS